MNVSPSRANITVRSARDLVHGGQRSFPVPATHEHRFDEWGNLRDALRDVAEQVIQQLETEYREAYPRLRNTPAKKAGQLKWEDHCR